MIPVAFSAGGAWAISCGMTIFKTIEAKLLWNHNLSTFYWILRFTSVQSFILYPVPSQNTHFRFVATCWRVLKFLSHRIGGFSFHVSVTRFLWTHCLNASISLGKFYCKENIDANGKLLLPILASNWFQNLIQSIWVPLNFVISSLGSFGLMVDKLFIPLLSLGFVISSSSSLCFSVFPCLNFPIFYSSVLVIVSYTCALL